MQPNFGDLAGIQEHGWQFISGGRRLLARLSACSIGRWARLAPTARKGENAPARGRLGSDRPSRLRIDTRRSTR